jgi:hypothetical protein
MILTTTSFQNREKDKRTNKYSFEFIQMFYTKKEKKKDRKRILTTQDKVKKQTRLRTPLGPLRRYLSFFTFLVHMLSISIIYFPFCFFNSSEKDLDASGADAKADGARTIASGCDVAEGAQTQVATREQHNGHCPGPAHLAQSNRTEWFDPVGVNIH